MFDVPLMLEQDHHPTGDDGSLRTVVVGWDYCQTRLSQSAAFIADVVFGSFSSTNDKFKFGREDSSTQ